jgi:serine phosphatase RsbU (regulator of sigma subunit)
MYYLEGYDKDWSSPTSVRFVSYTELPGGNYTFKVKATNSDGVWNENPTEIKIKVIPPWWKTMWFYVISGIVVFASVVGFFRYRTNIIKKENKILENKVSERTKELAEKNRDITSSIEYAKRIQEAILPSKDLIFSKLKNAFIIYKPKDIVSGDFYWATQKGNNVLLAAADCTGHGVPGAFMSMLGNDNLNEVIIDRNIIEPSKILEGARIGIIKALKQKGESGENKDGMDISMIAFDKETNILQYAGANNPLYIIRNNSKKKFSGYDYNLVKEKYSLLEIKGNKFPVGIYINNELPPFTNHSLQLETGDSIYVFSDGYADQFGGEKGKKLTKAKFREFILSIAILDMEEQRIKLLEFHEKYKGLNEQVDDICVIGVRV